jgi:hypothetical protein
MFISPSKAFKLNVEEEKLSEHSFSEEEENKHLIHKTEKAMPLVNLNQVSIDYSENFQISHDH